MSEGGTLGQITPHQSNIVASPNPTVEGHSVSSVKLVLITWIAAIGFDFLWHGGFLAEIYTRPNPALLDLEQAFIRIPLGYGSLLIQVVLLYWIFSLIGVNE